MAKKNKDCPKCPDCPKCLPGWLAAFGDLMSLLLCFFVLLLSMAIFDKPKVEEYFDVMRKSMGILDQSAESIDAANKTGQQTESINDVNEEEVQEDLEITKEEIKDEVASLNAAMFESTSESDQAVFTDGQKEFIIEVPASLLFKAGEYNLTNAKGKQFVNKISKIIRTMTTDFTIEVIGHTDKSSHSSVDIPRNNWDLSALRSIAIITELIKNKVDPATLKLAAFASYRPKSSISSKNRRVELRFFAEKDKQTALVEDNFFERLDNGQ